MLYDSAALVTDGESGRVVPVGGLLFLLGDHGRNTITAGPCTSPCALATCPGLLFLQPRYDGTSVVVGTTIALSVPSAAATHLALFCPPGFCHGDPNSCGQRPLGHAHRRLPPAPAAPLTGGHRLGGAPHLPPPPPPPRFPPVAPPPPPVRTTPTASGVNGGLVYELDMAAFPPPLAAAITTVRAGPDSPTALIECAKLIADSHSPAALPVLVDILGYNNPIAAAIAVDALSRPATRAAATPLLLQGVAAFNYSVNAYALRALGALRDGGVAGVVGAAATGGPIPNVRRAAAAALARLDVGDDVGGVWALLRGVAAEEQGDWSVRYAAVAAMEEFGVRGVGGGGGGGGGGCPRARRGGGAAAGAGGRGAHGGGRGCGGGARAAGAACVGGRAGVTRRAAGAGVRGVHAAGRPPCARPPAWRVQ
ncbi:hypothetical protein BU14_0135s0033 [Porphyra umbilicalis]|uniref:Uncharacterized protein n=1 Tax=Porphyra umbilicalis TaxID=2786 RepID=A0A1X6PA22_PORUM|nr:hypothetical protein BU14_0135s0033 [Porphyra umbilicalis]|eukprot:OSX77759.1 hypothetical protein BU14_0135s0033 [Porphyra umbilicalis]